MKKLLAILGSATLAVSTAATAVACAPLANQGKTDFSDFNNSLANMQGSAASIAKQLILADQFHISTKVLEDNLGDLNAKSVVESTTNLKYEDDDFNLSEDSDLADLNNQYFGNVKTDQIKLTGDIDLNGKVGLENDQLWGFLKDSLGVDLGEFSSYLDILFSMLSSMNTGGLRELIDQFLPGLNLKDLLDQLGVSFDLNMISTVVKGLLGNEDFVNWLTEIIDSFDIGNVYSNMKVSDLTSAAMISLTNAIGLFVDGDYQTIKLTKDDAKNSNKIASSLRTSGKNLGEMLGKMLFPTDDSQKLSFDFKPTNDFEKTIDRYGTAIASLVQFLEFIQFQFALFDDTKTDANGDDYQPADGQHLFVANKTNKEYIKELYQDKTLRDFAAVNGDGQIEGSLNLKYLLSIFRNAFQSLDDSNDENGYSFQKFFAILLITPNDFDINNEDSVPSPMGNYLGGLLLQILVAYLKEDLGGLATAITILDVPLKWLLTAFFEVLLVNPPKVTLTDVLISFLGRTDIQELLKTIGGLDLGLGPEIKEGLAAFTKYWKQGQGLKDLLAKVLDEVPLLSSEHSFQELYSGNPLNLKDLIGYLKSEELLTEIQKIYGNNREDKENDPLGKLMGFLADTIEGFAPTLDNLLPGDLNLKNLLTTPLNEIIGQSILPPAFGDHYLSQSINDIIREICAPNVLNVTGKEKLKEIPENFNFKLSYLKDIFGMILKYPYLPKGIDEKYRNMNLISILLENPDKVDAILGLKVDGNVDDKYDYVEGSLLHYIFYTILKIDQFKDKEGDVNNDPFKFLAVFLSSLFNNLNSPDLSKYKEAYQKLFSGETLTESDNAFEFDFQTLIEEDGALLGQVMVVNYHNPENNTDWVYTLNYSREKVSDLFQIRLFKKEAKVVE